MVTKQIGDIRENVTRIEIDHAVSAGVMWGSLGSEMVPIFEEHTTRLERNYTLEQWYALDPMERAMAVAMRRIDIAGKNLQADAEIRDAKRKSKQK